MYEIYLITNQINEKVYVGQTKRTLRCRFNDHKKSARSGANTYLYKAMRFYGWKRFTSSCLSSGLKTQEEANDKERFWVLYLRSNESEFGYNLTSGGGVGRVLSEEALRKIGDAGRKPNGPEQRCCGCKEVKPLEDFHINRAVSNGRMSRCKKCCLAEAKRRSAIRSKERAARRKPTKTRTQRACNHCGIVKPLDQFHRNKNLPDGHTYTCTACRAEERKNKTTAPPPAVAFHSDAGASPLYDEMWGLEGAVLVSNLSQISSDTLASPSA